MARKGVARGFSRFLDIIGVDVHPVDPDDENEEDKPTRRAPQPTGRSTRAPQGEQRTSSSGYARRSEPGRNERTTDYRAEGTGRYGDDRSGYSGGSSGSYSGSSGSYSSGYRTGASPSSRAGERSYERGADRATDRTSERANADREDEFWRAAPPPSGRTSSSREAPPRDVPPRDVPPRETSRQGETAESAAYRHQTVIFRIQTFEECREVILALIDKKSVLINLDQLEDSLIQRAIDTLGGAAFAIGATMRKASDKTYLIAPDNVFVANNSARAAGATRYM